MEDSLELLRLAEVNLPLCISVSISIGIVVDGILELLGMSVVKGNNLFAKSLLGAIMQDGGMRERSDPDNQWFWTLRNDRVINNRRLFTGTKVSRYCLSLRDTRIVNMRIKCFDYWPHVSSLIHTFPYRCIGKGRTRTLKVCLFGPCRAVG